MIAIGCDPGIHGAVAIINADGEISLYDMPILLERKKTVDALGVADLMRQYTDRRDVHVGIERVNSWPQMGHVGAFAFGRSAGVLHGVVGALRLPYSLIEPQRWQAFCLADMAGKDTKQKSVLRASQLYPHLADLFRSPRGVLHDGRSDALLIAHYVMQQWAFGEIKTPTT